MKEITNKRLIQFSINATIILIIYAFIFNIGIASAESGSMTIIDSTTKTWTVAAGGGVIEGIHDFSKIILDTSNYNGISTIVINTSQMGDSITYPAYNSTTFSITNGGTGTGTAYYNSQLGRLYWFFNNDQIITSNIITLTYASNIFSNVVCRQTPAPELLNNQHISINIPLEFYNSTLNKVIDACYTSGSINKQWWYEQVNVYNTVTNNYNVTYFSNNNKIYYNLSIKKTPSTISTKIIQTNGTGTNLIYQEPDFNNISNSWIFQYIDSLFINMSLQSGRAYFQTINTTSTLPLISKIIFGNITSNKENYNKTDNVNLSYNLTNANGRIRIVRPDNDITIFSIIDGLNQFKNYFIPSNAPIGEYFFYLDSFNTTTSIYENVDYSSFFVNPIGNASSINIQFDTYNIGNSMTIAYFINQTGYINLLDTNGNIKLNQSTISNSSQDIGYFISSNSITGLWMVNLYNSSGLIIDSDTTYINFGIIQPDVTVTVIPVITPISLIDISDNISQVVFGKITNENNEMDDIQVTKLGNKIYSTLLLLVVIILLMAVFKKGKK